jgi:hypothetical protein
MAGQWTRGEGRGASRRYRRRLGALWQPEERSPRACFAGTVRSTVEAGRRISIRGGIIKDLAGPSCIHSTVLGIIMWARGVWASRIGKSES